MPTTDRDGRCHSEVILSFYTGYPQPRESEAVPNAHSMDNVAHRGGDLHRNCRVDGERGHLARGRIGFDVRVTNERQALLPARARCEDHRHRRGNGRQPRRTETNSPLRRNHFCRPRSEPETLSRQDISPLTKRRGSIMPTIFDLLYREYCRARLVEMRKQLLLVSAESHGVPEANRDVSHPSGSAGRDSDLGDDSRTATQSRRLH